MTLSAHDVRRLLGRFHLHPDKRLGQNFLVDSDDLRKIVAAAELDRSDTVLEIGPGLGSLTRLLAKTVQRVVAVEVDGRLVPILEEILGGYANVELVQGDILTLDPARLMQLPDTSPVTYRVVANIPYYITSVLIRHLLASPQKPSRVVLTVQREVAQRIVAKPGDMNLLALSVQVFGNPRLAGSIPAESFYPSPNVESAIVRIDLDPSPRFKPDVLDKFFVLAKAGFSQKRKKLRNSIAGGLGLTTQKTVELLEGAGISPDLRAEDLSLDDWGTLAEHFIML
jgi:16S rRNA (adenine1518-N6/adenine1519-N6)-dimethyltransferase